MPTGMPYGCGVLFICYAAVQSLLTDKRFDSTLSFCKTFPLESGGTHAGQLHANDGMKDTVRNQQQIHTIMNRKNYASPLVRQVADVLLEQDLLQGPSSLRAVQAIGQEVVDDYSPYIGGDVQWD